MNRAPLSKNQRSVLENTVKKARVVVEQAARTELSRLGIHGATAPSFLNEGEKELRRSLRVHGRQLGDQKHADGSQEIDLLAEEIGYEHWHRMLFARFLIENELLIHPEYGAPINAEELDYEARKTNLTRWQQAGLWACQMLPQIFRNDHPAFLVRLDDIAERELEGLLTGLPTEVFTAGDSLGWVYQFWQAQRKEDINKSGVKIGARELPAVTQLFTEAYMVNFLLDNGLGAWWASRRLGSHDFATASSEQELRQKASLPGVPLEFLRFIPNEDGVWDPAAGSFPQWPKDLAQLKVLDPSCGSGHILVALFEMLVPLRMELEGLTPREAANLVLSQNIHALELDKRCVELAAFNLALAAWRYPGAGGYRPLPELHVACSGLGLGAAKQEWSQRFSHKGKNQRLALEWLYETFQNAPVLGSLINPARHQAASLLPWADLQEMLQDALKQEDHTEAHEAGVVAQGLTKAAELLSSRYTWVVTNVPYLGRGNHGTVLADFCEKHYPLAKADLATVFLDRCLEFCSEGGSASIVLPQNWLFLTTYRKFREKLLNNDTWHFIARLGEKGFDSAAAAGAFVALITLSRGKTSGVFGDLDKGPAQWIRGVDVMDLPNPAEKAAGLVSAEVKSVEQDKQLGNPDARVALDEAENAQFMSLMAIGLQGIATGDYPHFGLKFWEHNTVDGRLWRFHQSTPDRIEHYQGRTEIIFWEEGTGQLSKSERARVQGLESCSSKGIVVGQMRLLPVSLHKETTFDNNCAVLIPHNPTNLPAIWCFCSSPEYNEAVRQIDQSLKVTNATLVKVPFDLERWQKVADQLYPHGLPQPYTNDPTQWIFHGNPTGSVVWDEKTKVTSSAGHRTDDTVLQVAVARLLGYRWPAEIDPAMELAPQQRAWVDQCQNLLPFANEDGIVCIPPVRGERSADERLRALLREAYSGPFDEDTLLTACDSSGLTLETWLRDKFFEQHCKLFGHRPFIWHLWDGDPKGFSALVNYHKLDYSNLERLTFTYLGDWITQKDEEAKRNVAGADSLAQKARNLQTKLKLILQGESPYDIFVRWKPLEDQPLGWNPDLNDGVRLNIRPFVTAEILRHYKKPKLNINWDKDRGKDVASAPWFGVHKGERINDWHTTLEEKKKARE